MHFKDERRERRKGRTEEEQMKLAIVNFTRDHSPILQAADFSKPQKHLANEGRVSKTKGDAACRHLKK